MIIDVDQLIESLRPRVHAHCAARHHRICAGHYGGSRCSCSCHTGNPPVHDGPAADALAERRVPGEPRR